MPNVIEYGDFFDEIKFGRSRYHITKVNLSAKPFDIGQNSCQNWDQRHFLHLKKIFLDP